MSIKSTYTYTRMGLTQALQNKKSAENEPSSSLPSQHAARAADQNRDTYVSGGSEAARLWFEAAPRPTQAPFYLRNDPQAVQAPFREDEAATQTQAPFYLRNDPQAVQSPFREDEAATQQTQAPFWPAK